METPSSLELTLEHMKCLSNLKFQLLECVYDGRPIAERYMKGDDIIHVHGLAGDYRFYGTWRPSDADWAGKNCKVAVFVGIGDTGECLRPIASVTRLQPLDRCNMLVADTFESSLPVGPEALFRILNKKLRALYDLAGIEASQVINQVIQSGSQIVDDLPNEKTDDWWYGFDIDREYHSTASHPFLSTIWQSGDYWLTLNDNTIVYCLEDGINSTVQIRQVYTCPSNPLIRAIERLHLLYST